MHASCRRVADGSTIPRNDRLMTILADLSAWIRRRGAWPASDERDPADAADEAADDGTDPRPIDDAVVVGDRDLVAGDRRDSEPDSAVDRLAPDRDLHRARVPDR